MTNMHCKGKTVHVPKSHQEKTNAKYLESKKIWAPPRYRNHCQQQTGLFESFNCPRRTPKAINKTVTNWRCVDPSTALGTCRAASRRHVRHKMALFASFNCPRRNVASMNNIREQHVNCRGSSARDQCSTHTQPGPNIAATSNVGRRHNTQDPEAKCRGCSKIPRATSRQPIRPT